MYRTTSIDMDMHQFNSDHNRIHSALFPGIGFVSTPRPSKLARRINEADKEGEMVRAQKRSRLNETAQHKTRLCCRLSLLDYGGMIWRNI